MTSSIDTRALSQLGLAGRAPESSGDKLGQEEFMRLMITQLRNQDPFSPMESGEFLGQIAQFGTVSGIEEVRTALEALSGSMLASQSLQAAGLVDRDVLVPAREAWLPPQGSVRGAIDVPPGATNVAVDVYDLGGRLVASIPVDGNGHNQNGFEWDGALADGEQAASGYYELRATGTVAGENVALETFVRGRVESVSVSGGSVALTVTGLGVVSFADVRGIG